jgi:hypothetical protein
MRLALSLVVVLAAGSVARAADLAGLPDNTWVEIKYTTDQPAEADEKGTFGAQGWNKLVYDSDGKRVLFYDRWIDKKHGGWTIYGNCLFAFDAAAGKLTPVKIDNWTKMDPKGGGYRTLALPDNDKEPTPSPRHVYHCFEYVSDLQAVFLCNGANQTIIDKDGKLVGHDLADGAWRLDLETNRWTQLTAAGCPPNHLDDAMAYCPETKTIVYVSGGSQQISIFDIAKNDWRKAAQSPPRRAASGNTIVYDPTKQRMLILGGGRLEGQFNQAKSPDLRQLFAFDPRTEQVERLADCPTAVYEGHLAYDSKRGLFFTAAAFKLQDQPSGMFAYNPQTDAWHEVPCANAVPASNNWFAWVQMCFDAHHDCLIAKVRETFFAFRYVPAK